MIGLAFPAAIRVSSAPMKPLLFLLPTVAAVVLGFTAQAAPTAREQAFLDAYRKALESRDEKALAAFLYTEGAKPEQIEFFKMMQALDPGATVKSVELVTPTPEQMARLNEPMEMPDGQTYKMPIQPIRQLVVTSELKDESGSSTSTRKAPVAEKDGKLVIPVPVPAGR